MVSIGNKKYYTIDECAVLAGVSVRTLRRWLADCRLSDFLFPFRAATGEMLYRMEEPEDTDRKNGNGEWMIPDECGMPEGGASDEGGSSS